MAALSSDPNYDREAFGKALLSGDVASVYFFLLNGYDPNMHLDWLGATPLMYCELNSTEQTRAKCQQLLLKYGADSAIEDMFGDTVASTKDMIKKEISINRNMYFSSFNNLY